MTIIRKVVGWLAVATTLLSLVAYAVPSSFERAVANVLISEGYTYTDTPGDPGGPTNMGITLGDVRLYLNPQATAMDVQALTLAQARGIYRQYYWNLVGGDILPAGVDYVVFDYAVNAGRNRAIPALLACLTPGITPSRIIVCVTAQRLGYQMGLPHTLDKFKKGWRNRILSVEAIGLKMAGSSVDKGKLNSDIYLVPRIGGGKAYEVQE